MLKKLQRKFILIAVAALSVIVFVQVLAVNVINIYQRDSEIRNILYLIAGNGGAFPNSYREDSSYINSLLNPFRKVQITIETPYSTRYFVVKLTNNTVTEISTKNIAAVSDSDAFEFASRVYTSEPGFGFLDSYRYYYEKDEATGKAIMVFIDFTRELDATFKLASGSVAVGLICLIILLLPVCLLSKNAIRPIEKSLKKQKQFITDAGHELKTPIAIINADAEVLEMCEGENEWITSIKNQTRRLDSLVKNLVTLSKLEESGRVDKKDVFNLSEAVEDSVKSFETLAAKNGVSMTYHITPGVFYNGNEQEIRQLVTILADNAVKYCKKGGSIRTSVYKSAKSVVISMYNDCEHIDKSKLGVLFDRFYRADDSRARETGGYGIGLSIAQVIVQRHKGKITATSSDEKSVIFKVVL